MNKENLLLSPEERKRRQEERLKNKEVETMKEKVSQVEPLPEIESSDDEKYKNKGGLVKVQFESEGRFSLPVELYFSDYTVKDINDLTLCREEDLLETLIVIVQRCCIEEEKINESLIEEFLEILIGMKIQYNTKYHKHRWLCECQAKLDEDDREFSEDEIDLTEIKYKSLSEAEDELRNYYRDIFKKLNDKEFQSYLVSKYGSDTKYTVEQELEKIIIKEPYTVNDEKGNIYRFRFTRIKDLIKGYNLACQEYDPQLTRARHRVEDKEGRDKKIKDLNAEKAKQAVLNAKALSLVEFNGERISDKKKIELFSSMKRQIALNLSKFLNMINFGVYDKRELTCNFCGKKLRGWLQQLLNPFELIPISDDNKPVTNHESGGASAISVYFGV